ncbi:MAG: hypothetical protein WAM60_20225 [Candidatus Promineifilaceae bacterium]
MVSKKVQPPDEFQWINDKWRCPAVQSLLPFISHQTRTAECKAILYEIIARSTVDERIAQQRRSRSKRHITTKEPT